MNSKLYLDPAQLHSCSLCGKCCRGWLVPVTPDEKDRISRLRLSGDYSEAFDVHPVRKGMFILKKLGKDCIFLGRDNKCIIHSEHGHEAKPLACRLYPYNISRWTDGAVSMSLRYDCPESASGRGTASAEKLDEIHKLAAEMKSAETARAEAVYSRDFGIGLEKIRTVSHAYRNFLTEDLDTLVPRLFGAKKLLDFHSLPTNRADIENAGSDFAEDASNLINRSIEDLVSEIESSNFPELHSRVMFRGILGNYVRNDDDLIWLTFYHRIFRALSLVKFSLGKGSLKRINSAMPVSTGIDPLKLLRGSSFARDCFEPFVRYISNRLMPMHICGGSCRGLSFEEGMRHLIIAFPATAALAAMLAGEQGAEKVSRDDFIRAIMAVDRTFANSAFFGLARSRKMERGLSRNALGGLLAPLWSGCVK